MQTPKIKFRGMLRISTLMFLAFVFNAGFTESVSAQTQTVTMNPAKTTAGKAIEDIEKQTGMVFGVSDSFDMSRNVDFGQTQMPLSDAIEKLVGSGYTYEFYDRYILIRNKPTVLAEQHTATQENIAQVSQTEVSREMHGNANVTAAAQDAAPGAAVVPLLNTPALPEFSFIMVGKPGEAHEIVQQAEVSPAEDSGKEASIVTSGRDYGNLPSENPYVGFSPKVALKTNVLQWATTTPNLGIEFAMGKRTTLSLEGAYNPFLFDGKYKQFRHWMAQPEFRWWTCERFSGGYIGLHAVGGEFNVGDLGFIKALDGVRYQGYFAGAGISYGHHFYISPHWNLELTIGVGYVYMDYERYDCLQCGQFDHQKTRHYFGPTKAGLSFVYLFNSKK